MHDLNLFFQGTTFKNSTATWYESHLNNFRVVIRNNFKHDIFIVFLDLFSGAKIEITDLIKDKECITKTYDYSMFSNKTILIYVKEIDEINYLEVKIPESGSIKLFLNINKYNINK